MKNFLTYVLGAGAVYIAIQYFRKAKAATILNIKLRTIKLQPLSKAAVRLEIINPTNARVNFNSVVADLVINDFALGTLNYQKPTAIPANGTINVDLNIKVNPLESLSFIRTLFSNKNKSNTVKIVGNVSGEGVVVPINIEQNLKF